MTIKGGYILQPRVIQESDINISPPYVREIWNYLLREANSKDMKYNGNSIKRGQLFRSYNDIKEGTKWFIGWRKMTYHENHVKKAMKFLRDTGRITTTKELGGVLITICKYDYYQDPKNYDRTIETTIDGTNEEPMKNHPIPNNNKKEKERKRKEEEYKDFFPDNDLNSLFIDYLKMRVSMKKPATDKAIALCIKKLNDMSNGSIEKMKKIIEQSIMNSWQGLFDIKEQHNTDKKGTLA